MRHEENTKRQEDLVIGAFVYDRASGQITDPDGRIVRVRRQSAEVLSVLAEDAGEVVTKERLIESVWPGIPTTDDSLVQCIARIRRTLGHEVVETFPKRGYRLRLGSGPAPPRRLPTRRSLPVALAICVALALTAATNLAFQRKPIDVSDPIIPPAIESDRTLAVLPFVNLSGDPDLRYFSDGLSEDLTTDLSKVQDLTVISQASSFDFRDAELGFQRIAEDLCGTSYEGPFATTPIASGSTWP